MSISTASVEALTASSQRALRICGIKAGPQHVCIRVQGQAGIKCSLDFKIRILACSGGSCVVESASWAKAKLSVIKKSPSLVVTTCFAAHELISDTQNNCML